MGCLFAETPQQRRMMMNGKDQVVFDFCFGSPKRLHKVRYPWRPQRSQMPTGGDLFNHPAQSLSFGGLNQGGQTFGAKGLVNRAVHVQP